MLALQEKAVTDGRLRPRLRRRQVVTAEKEGLEVLAKTEQKVAKGAVAVMEQAHQLLLGPASLPGTEEMGEAPKAVEQAGQAGRAAQVDPLRAEPVGRAVQVAQAEALRAQGTPAPEALAEPAEKRQMEMAVLAALVGRADQCTNLKTRTEAVVAQVETEAKGGTQPAEPVEMAEIQGMEATAE